MGSFSQIHKFSICVIGGFKTGIHARVISPVICNSYSSKSTESLVGKEKPKRPLTPYFKFMVQIRPALLAKNPKVTGKEVATWTSKHWQQLDSATKEQMRQDYKKDYDDYKKTVELYELSLTDQQKDVIKRAKEDSKRIKEEKAAAKEKRRLKAEARELGKPKKPVNSYLLFMQTKTELMKDFKQINLNELHAKVKEDWLKLPDAEKSKFIKQAREQKEKYSKDLDAWEAKMIEIGRTDLVRNQSTTSIEKKSAQKK